MSHAAAAIHDDNRELRTQRGTAPGNHNKILVTCDPFTPTIWIYTTGNGSKYRPTGDLTELMPEIRSKLEKKNGTVLTTTTKKNLNNILCSPRIYKYQFNCATKHSLSINPAAAAGEINTCVLLVINTSVYHNLSQPTKASKDFAFTGYQSLLF